jgi:sporulation protein YlmC with PRC-barrel domain
VNREIWERQTWTAAENINSAGEDLGKIEEIMIDVPTGRVAYAVLSFGGFLGMGDKLFALPWDALKLNEDEHEFILNVDKATLENAPGFDQDDWPDMADPNWAHKFTATTAANRIGRQMARTAIARLQTSGNRRKRKLFKEVVTK